jgi:hypothetical protein
VVVGGRTIVVGELISMTEYSVAVTVIGLAVGVMVMSTVCVDFGPATVCVDMTTSVVGGKVSVSTTVCVVGDGVSVTVLTIVTSPCPAVFVEAAEPPSTGTTEYVALGAREISCAKNGKEDPKQKNDNATKSNVVLRRMLRIDYEVRREEGYLREVRKSRVWRRTYQGSSMVHVICSLPMAIAFEEVGEVCILEAGVSIENARAGKVQHQICASRKNRMYKIQMRYRGACLAAVRCKFEKRSFDLGVLSC